MIAVGVFRIVVLGEGAEYAPTLADQVTNTVQPLTAILLLRAFAAGAVALTGTEAIATGVPAFQPPEAKNAATTLGVMAALLGVLFIGITFLATSYAISPIEFPEKQTVISQVSRQVFGEGIPFYLFQAFTALLLFLAANTSFNAFPRLLAILAVDGFMPRQFSMRGDRLAFSWGIVMLASIAAGADRDLPRRDPPADPAVRRRRVHRLHDQPDRHDPALAARAVAGLAAAPGDQRVRRGADRGRGRDRDLGEVLRRRLDRARRSSRSWSP